MNFILCTQKLNNAAIARTVKVATKIVQPLLSCVDNGLVGGANQINIGLYHAGKALKDTTTGVGQIVSGALSGVGNSLAVLPATVEGVANGLDHSLIGSILNAVL